MQDDNLQLDQLRVTQHQPQSLEDRARRNAIHVFVERLTGDLDDEQANQALQALNGTDRSDE